MVTSSKTCRKGLKVDSPAKQAKSQRVKHLGIVLFVAGMNMLSGNILNIPIMASPHYQTLLMDMNITDCINLKKAGCSANGLPMLLTFI